MSEDLVHRVRAVDWARFRTALGRADEVGDLILVLAGRAAGDPLDASDRLGAMLCHQHAYASSAAAPAMPFLVEILAQVSDEVRLEVLELLLGLAGCTRHDTLPGVGPGWRFELRSTLRFAWPTGRASLAESASPAIRELIRQIDAELGL